MNIRIISLAALVLTSSALFCSDKGDEKENGAQSSVRPTMDVNGKLMIRKDRPIGGYWAHTIIQPIGENELLANIEDLIIPVRLKNITFVRTNEGISHSELYDWQDYLTLTPDLLKNAPKITITIDGEQREFIAPNFKRDVLAIIKPFMQANPNYQDYLKKFLRPQLRLTVDNSARRRSTFDDSTRPYAPGSRLKRPTNIEQRRKSLPGNIKLAALSKKTAAQR